MNFKRIKSHQRNCFEGILKCKYIQEWAVVIYRPTLDPPLCPSVVLDIELSTLYIRHNMAAHVLSISTLSSATKLIIRIDLPDAYIKMKGV